MYFKLHFYKSAKGVYFLLIRVQSLLGHKYKALRFGGV